MNTDFLPDDLDRKRLRKRRFWYGLAIMLFVLSMFVQQPLLFLAALFSFVFGFVPAWWYHHALRYLAIRQQVYPQRLFFGEEVVISLTIENQKWLPLPWLACEEQVRPLLPILVKQGSQQETIGQIDNSGLLWSFQRVTRHYRMRCSARGLYIFGPLTLSSTDPFGWLKRQVTLPLYGTLLVYPLIASLEELGLAPLSLFGEGVTARRLFEDPLRIIGVRDYQLGDDPRRIHWKATARSGELRSKIYEYSNLHRVLLLLDTGSDSTAMMEISREMHEFSVAVAASLAVYALDEGYMVGVVTNCAWLTSPERAGASQTVMQGKKTKGEQFKPAEMAPAGVSIPFARDPGQYERLLTTFSRLVPYMCVSMEQIIEREDAMFAPGTTVILVSSVRTITQVTIERLLDMRSRGIPVQIILTGEQDRKTMPATYDVPVHYLGGREKWHELIQAFVDGTNQAAGSRPIQL